MTIAERVPLEIQEFVVSVGQTPTRILLPDPGRIGIVVSNTGSNQIALGLNDNIGLTAGINLPAQSLPYHISDEVLPGVAARGFFAIANTASTNLYVLYVRALD